MSKNPAPKNPLILSDLLNAVRRLRRALEHPIDYPGRPGKQRIDLAEHEADLNREGSIFCEFYTAVHPENRDGLPLTIGIKLSELINDFQTLMYGMVGCPNDRHWRALESVREIEAALVAQQGEGESATKPDGPFDADGFRFRGAEVRFPRAVKRYRLVMSLWDAKKKQLAEPRPIEDVISEVWGEENETSDSAFRQLCADTRRDFEAENCPLGIQQTNGKVQLLPR